MLKLQYDEKTGVVGKAYPSSYDVAIPYKEIDEETNDKIAADAENIYFVVNDELTTTPTDGYKAKLTAQNEALFNANFVKSSFGYLRKIPQGFSDLMSSFDTALNNCRLLAKSGKKLPANTIKYYQLPDFTKTQAEIEADLLANIKGLPEMDEDAFAPYYLEVSQIWLTIHQA